MGIHFSGVGIALVLAGAIGLVVPSRSLLAQAIKTEEVKPQIVLNKLFPPVYPRLARQALIAGDVRLMVSIRSDGSVKSVTPIDGHPLLVQAALDSARQSQFECKDCGRSDVVERTFTYSFQSSEQKPADSSCCLEEEVPPDEAPSVRVSQSDERITITVPARCICSDEYLGTLVDRRMRLIAGHDALDCGRVKLNGDPRQSLGCARRAISQRRAFVVRFDYAGMDSSLSDGFAGDGSGKVYSVRFDSLGWGPSPGIQILDNSHDAVEICAKPVHLKLRSAPTGAFWGYRCSPVEK